MNQAERLDLMSRVRRSRWLERAAVREALASSAVTESIGRRLGDELIAAAQEIYYALDDVTIATNEPSARRRVENAKAWIGKLVVNDG